jgi:hypothetical protein
MKKKKKNKEKNWKRRKSNDATEINRCYLFKNMVTLGLCCPKSKIVTSLGILFRGTVVKLIYGYGN